MISFCFSFQLPFENIAFLTINKHLTQHFKSSISNHSSTNPPLHSAISKTSINQQHICHHRLIHIILIIDQSISYLSSSIKPTTSEINMNQTLNDPNSYIETEFFFYLIPSYYALLAFIWRHQQINHTAPVYYAYALPAQHLYQFIIKQVSQNEQSLINSQGLTYKTPPASYVIKSKLCLLNAILYLLMIFLSFVSTSSIFYSANHRPQSFFYVFGFLAWYSAAFVLRTQFQRNISQSIWIHRLFWILAGTFSIYKMFEDYFLPLNLIFNAIFIASNFVLAVYGIYRPQDTDILEMTVSNDDIPGFVKIFFEGLELNQLLRKVFRIEDAVIENRQQGNDNMQYGNGSVGLAIGKQQLLQIGTVFKYSAQTIKEQINLLKELPRRNVFVDQRIRYLKVNDRIKGCFFIITQIDSSRAQAERTFQQFIQLYQHLKQIFSPQNFPKHQLPLFKAPVTPYNDPANEQIDSGKRSQHIQKWLDQIFKSPIFMTKEVLQFLNVDSQQAAPFTTYFEHSYKMFCSKHFMLLLQNKKKLELKGENEGQGKEKAFLNQDKLVKEETDNERLLKMMKRDLQFTVSSEGQSSSQQSFSFVIGCVVDKKGKYSWSINKTQEKILLLNQKIEDDCNCSVPSFYSIIASRQKNHNSKLEAYRTYMHRLLNNKRYFCTSLFRFIEFDPIGVEVRKEGGWWVSEGGRKGGSVLEYEDKGSLIEVTRIKEFAHADEQYSISVDIRKRNAIFPDKTSEELQAFRTALMIIYRGVSSIPQLILKHTDKLQIKKSVETFLLKIQNLPKIQINKDYARFYQTISNQLPFISNHQIAAKTKKQHCSP